MPLDKVVISHLDEQDALEDRLDKDIDDLLGQITVRELMADVEGVLMAVVSELQERLKMEYYGTAAKNGIEFARKIQEDGDIQIQKTKDPDLNA